MVSAADRVTAALRRDVLDGVLPPGSRIPEALLAQRYGTSRVPVREAVRALAAEGFLDLRPHAGASVAQVPVDDLADLYAVRIVAEGITAARCAGRVAAGEGDELVADLTRIVDAGFAALEADSPAQGAALNTEFHASIARLSQARSMAVLLRRVGEQIQWAYATTVPQQGRRAWTEHRRIVAAIAAGDEARARAAMERHIEASRRSFRGTAG